MKQNQTRILASLTVAGALALGSSAASAQLAGYYIGVDGRQTIPSGTYAGLENPNYNRLTLLLNHGDHYHSKGIHLYTGPNLGADTATTISSSNYLPEGAAAPFSLTVGTGLYAGKLVSFFDPSSYQSNITFDFTDSLAGFSLGSDEQILHDSSGSRWNGSLGDAHVHLVLDFLTPGLNVGDAGNLSIMSNPGDDWHVSAGFAPTFWTELGAGEGVYIARFKLVDEEGIFGDSGTFEYRFQVTAVPEPSAFATLAGTAALGFAALRRRRR
jgi:hypothetical protein